MTPGDRIDHAQLEWDADDQPVSSSFGDVYFSRANGLQETRHVFIQHNQLTERWQALAESAHFTIAETGFGSGLNFLAAWQHWREHAPKGAQLHFVTVEKFPLTRADLSRALRLWPELSDLADALISAYPVFTGTGVHRLVFDHGRVSLTLIINDAALGFEQMLASSHPLFADHCARVDAWFLDGFAPAKNPQMWSDALFTCIGQLSRPGTTAATFSAAGIVKQGLKLAGFTIQKVPGFGRKREMVKAVQTEQFRLPVSELALARSYSPFPLPWAIHEQRTPAVKQLVVIGGGLAGCTSARALAERGWQVTLIERNPELAQEASGNPLGVLYTKLSHRQETLSEFNLAALQYALGFYRPYWPQVGAQTGVLQLAHTEAEQQQQALLQARFGPSSELLAFVNAEQASAIAGIDLPHGGAYFPQAGWINPRQLCERLVDHPGIQVLRQCQALKLSLSESTNTDTNANANANADADDNQARKQHSWQLFNPQGELICQAPIVVIANARDAAQFSQSAHLPVNAIRGQISYLPTSASSGALKTVICAEGYLAPATAGSHCLGATFNLREQTLELRAQDHQTNLDNLALSLPALASQWQPLAMDKLDGRVAFRCTLPDYLPAVGPVADEPAMLERFGPLRKNARAPIHLPGCYHPGLFINVGHGSRGLAYTPLCAQLLAAHINQEPIPLPRALANALQPARFLIRDLIKSRR